MKKEKDSVIPPIPKLTKVLLGLRPKLDRFGGFVNVVASEPNTLRQLAAH